MERIITILLIIVAAYTSATAQTDGWGVDVADPQEKLDISGALKIGTTTNSNNGTIRYNDNDFEGYHDGEWRSFTSPSGSTVYVEDWGTSGSYSPGSTFHAVTSYSNWMDVESGDVLKVMFSLSCRPTSGFNDDDLYFRVYVDGDSGCSSFNTEHLYYTVDPVDVEHVKAKPISYLDVVPVTCTGRMRYRIEVRNAGDDSFEVRDRSLAVTKY